MNDHIGAGWCFPLGMNQRGDILLASGIAKIEQSIKIILGTRIGERVNAPDLRLPPPRAGVRPLRCRDARPGRKVCHRGTQLLGAPDRSARNRAEPDQRSPQNTLSITILYRIKETNDERNLVYPFYRIPGEPRTDR